MAKFNWDKIRDKSEKFKKAKRISDLKENIKQQKMLSNDTNPASLDQKMYIKSMSNMTIDELDTLSVNEARKIIAKYESKTPASEKQKNTIRKHKFLLESKIEFLTISEARKVIESGKKILEKRKKLENAKKKAINYNKKRKK